MKNATVEKSLLCIHEEVDDTVNRRVCHGQPEEGEKHMLGVGLGGHSLKHYDNHNRENVFAKNRIKV